MADVLGTLSFLDTPDVNGVLVLTASSGVNSVSGTANQIAVSGAIPAYTVGLASDAILPGTGSLTLPIGTTAQRPASPLAGMVRYNSTLGYNEKYTGAYWSPFGLVLQQVTGAIAAQTATNSQTPLDATAPTSAEGTQIWTQAFTPISATSRIIISYSVTNVHSTAARTQIMSVFAGSTNIGTIVTTCTVAASYYPATHQVVYSPGSVTAITFSCRVGSSGNGAWYINSAATNTLGGTMASQFLITEIE